MLDIKRRMQVISDLLDLNTPESVTYAALECRLAIEYLCYDRMKMALGLASYADMGGWTPSKVVKAVEELVDEHIVESCTILSAQGLDLPAGQQPTKEDYEKLDFKPIGSQAAIDMKQIVKLWNALSKAALHVQVPKLPTDTLAIYGSQSKTIKKVRECLTEFAKIAVGTMLTNGFSAETSISCDGCGFPVRRRIKYLEDKQTVSCVNPDCDESYTVELVNDKDVNFVRRQALFDCQNCRTTISLPMKQLENKKAFEMLEIACKDCGRLHRVGSTPVVQMVEVES
jgi:hypothetical protein